MSRVTKILVVIPQLHGRVWSAANELSSRLGRRRAVVQLVAADKPAHTDDYDIVMLGAELGCASDRHALAGYLERHRSLLDRLPSALFLVSPHASVSVAHPGQLLRAFQGMLSWTPSIAATIVYRHRDPHVRRLLTGALRSLVGAMDGRPKVAPTARPIDELGELVEAVVRAPRYRPIGTQRAGTTSALADRHDEPHRRDAGRT